MTKLNRDIKTTKVEASQREKKEMQRHLAVVTASKLRTSLRLSSHNGR